MKTDSLNAYLQQQLSEDQADVCDLLLTQTNALQQNSGQLAHQILLLQSRANALESENHELRALIERSYVEYQKLYYFLLVPRKIVKFLRKVVRLLRPVLAVLGRIRAAKRYLMGRADGATPSGEAVTVMVSQAESETRESRPIEEQARITPDVPPLSDLERRNQRDLAALQALHHSVAPLSKGANITTKRLMIDVTHTISTTSVSGIQRMVRNIACEAMKSGGQPVRILGRELSVLAPDQSMLQPCEITADSILLLPDVSWLYIDDLVQHMQANKAAGGRNIFVLTDILSVTLPLAFPLPARNLFKQWLHRCVFNADAVICISQVTADELRMYFDNAGVPNMVRPSIGWVHCGVEPLAPTASTTSERLKPLLPEDATPYFLSVSTLEIRKGYPVILDAIDQLWESGKHFRYVIVGRYGWSQHALIRRIQTHPEFGKRLIWLEDIDDNELAWLYAKAHALISASIAEGFGLPIIEAAHYGTRAIVSDIPVYREIFGENVTYFECLNAKSLAHCIRGILSGPKPTTSLPLRSWQQAVDEMLDMAKNEAYQYPARGGGAIQCLE